MPKGLKNFVPDGAIGSLQALIEVKFVDSQSELPQIFSGIMEDLSGYGGSRDWTRFYSLIYQTQPFVNEIRFDRSLRLSGNAGSWKPIVDVGAGGRIPKQRKVEVPSSAPSPQRGRRRANELDEKVAEVLPRLSETFTASDVCRLLDHKPDRASLYRVLQRLKLKGQLAVDFAGSGTSPSIIPQARRGPGKLRLLTPTSAGAAVVRAAIDAWCATTPNPGPASAQPSLG
jgi:hypothetical protein